MQAFAHALVELHALAMQAGPQEFAPEALRLFGRWLGFDGAVLGMGDAEPAAALAITQAHVQGRGPGILDDYARVSAGDPVTDAFVQGLQRPMAVDCAALYRRRRRPELESFSQAHGLRHLMIFGERPQEGRAGRWLVLYRADDRPFTRRDADHLQLGWAHLSQAIVQHRATLLSRCQSPGAGRACALADGDGRLELADRRFVELLQREWPDHAGTHLPQAVREAAARGSAYRGSLVEIRLRRQDGAWACEASETPATPGLTPGQNAVARRFAAGLSAKEIARELGVSPNTVRTQLTQLYARLGVHDKASLARRIPPE